MKIIAIILMLLVSPVHALSNKEKATEYCNTIIRALTIISIKARNHGTDKFTVISKMSSTPQFKDNKQLKSDLTEVVNFVYNEGVAASDKRIENFLVYEWCMGQIDTFNYK